MPLTQQQILSRHYRCLYCGHKELEKIPNKNENLSGKEKQIHDKYIEKLKKDLAKMGIDPEAADDKNQYHDFRCKNCGIVIFEADLEEAAKRALENKEHRLSGGDVSEEETLQAAWQLMQKQGWRKASDILFPTSPDKHAPEFLVFRGVCSLGSLIEEMFGPAIRCDCLDKLNGNLKRAEFYLNSGSESANYGALQKMYQALMLLGDLKIECKTNYDKDSNYIDNTNRRRTDVLCTLAEMLEKRGSEAEHGTEYLKMAVSLYHKCLELAQEKYCHILLSRESSKFQIAAETRRRINDRIVSLNEAIRKRDSSFVPKKALPDPKIMPNWVMYLSACVPALFLAAVAGIASFNQVFLDRLIVYIMNGYLPILLFFVVGSVGSFLYYKYNNI